MKVTLCASFLALFSILFISVAGAQSMSAKPPEQPSEEKAKDTITKAHVGVKLAGSFNQINGNQSFKPAFQPGILGGGFIRVIHRKIGIQVEGLVSYAQYGLQDTFISGGKLRAINIDIPVLFKYKIVHHLWVEIGPQFSTLLAVSHKPESKTDARKLFQSENFSGVIGLEGKLHRVTVGARYVLGLTNVNNEGYSVSNQDWKTSSIQVYAGLSLFKL